MASKEPVLHASLQQTKTTFLVSFMCAGNTHLPVLVRVGFTIPEGVEWGVLTSTFAGRTDRFTNWFSVVPITGRFAILPMVCVSWPFTWCLNVFNFMRLLCVTQVTEGLSMLLASQDQVHSRRWSRQCNSWYFYQCTQSSDARRTSRFTIGCNIVVHRSPTLIHWWWSSKDSCASCQTRIAASKQDFSVTEWTSIQLLLLTQDRVDRDQSLTRSCTCRDFTRPRQTGQVFNLPSEKKATR